MTDSDIGDEALSIQAKMEMCERLIGHSFGNKELLQAALTHASVASSRLHSNERLEFLGDSVLGLVVSQTLFERYPSYSEGDLTKIKSVVVSRRVCAKISRMLGLENCLIVGKGISSTSGVPRSLLSDVLESIVAAVFLDAGLETAKHMLLTWIDPEILSAIGGHTGGNYKSMLQQLIQQDFGKSPTYQVVSERGPDHVKTFLVSAVVDGRSYSPAWGRSKKDAQQRAAGNALAEIRGEEAPYSTSKVSG